MIDRAEAIVRLQEPLRSTVEACMALIPRLDDPDDRTMLVIGAGGMVCAEAAETASGKRSGWVRSALGFWLKAFGPSMVNSQSVLPRGPSRNRPASLNSARTESRTVGDTQPYLTTDPCSPLAIDVPDEFQPQLNSEHDQWRWIDPKQAVQEAQAPDPDQMLEDELNAPWP
jgi:hypothetical protein